jgi:hypothetical protein
LWATRDAKSVGAHCWCAKNRPWDRLQWKVSPWSPFAAWKNRLRRAFGQELVIPSAHYHGIVRLEIEWDLVTLR